MALLQRHLLGPQAEREKGVTFVGTQDMAADIFTKPLEYVAYDRGARMLGLSPARGE
jgi:hypothetical protein